MKKYLIVLCVIVILYVLMNWFIPNTAYKNAGIDLLLFSIFVAVLFLCMWEAITIKNGWVGAGYLLVYWAVIGILFMEFFKQYLANDLVKIVLLSTCGASVFLFAFFRIHRVWKK